MCCILDMDIEMKWDWTLLLLICGLLFSSALCWFVFTENKQKELCPLGNDKLVTVIVEKHKITCVYTKENLRTKKKYTREMWNE